ncbi:MAG: hypothetical protein IPM42_08920 [Saprospiraceae bacterium]|nr:hypothetical protein [Saprospiraceae bacterium]
MNNYRNCCLVIVTLMIGATVFAQNPGLVIQTGLSAAFNRDARVTEKGQGHYGWMVGADARLLDGDLYFLIGGQYHQTNLKSVSSGKFFKENDLDLLMLRLGLGFNLWHLSDHITFRSKLLGSINFVMSSPDGGLGIEGFKEINDSFLGATTGLGVTIGALDVDLEYQYGVINAFRRQSDSLFDFWTLSFGFHF